MRVAVDDVMAFALAFALTCVGSDAKAKPATAYRNGDACAPATAFVFSFLVDGVFSGQESYFVFGYEIDVFA